MNKFNLSMVGLLILMFVTSSLLGQESKINQSDLIGCWTDSREENLPDSGLNIYRPCDYKKFPFSRFRFKMDLRKDFTCSWFHLSSSDRHGMKEGKWTFDNKTNILKIYNLEGRIEKQFLIAELNKDIMKIKN